MASTVTDRLVPLPRSIQVLPAVWEPGALALPTHGLPLGGPGSLALARVRDHHPVVAAGEAVLTFSLVGDSLAPPEAYRLEVHPNGATCSAPSARGLDHAARTLAQLLRGASTIPCLVIEDHPDLAPRGVMLDVSRDRVPTQAWLMQTIDILAECKVSQLQLYMEHAFAYQGHEEVWRDSSPFTPDEIRELDAYCAARGVELVPNQNAFGHMHRWLTHPAYAHLAECPEGVEHAFARDPEPFGLCPTEPAVLPFLEGLFDQLLPCFTSRQFNVGMDETIDLGLGRSKELCSERGTGRVYLDFLNQVHARVHQRGRRMQYWGDIALEYPELIPELPSDALALLWGYEAGHPFEENAGTFAEHGIPFCICPGTSSWQSLLGRPDNARQNLREAAAAAVRHGAVGWLVTDWGDFGHWQPYLTAWPGLLLGASFGWNAAEELPGLEHAIDAVVAPNQAGLGSLLLDLGMAHQRLASPARNATSLFQLLRRPHLTLPNSWCPELQTEGLEAYIQHVSDDLLPKLQARASEAPELSELVIATRISLLAADLGLAWLACGPGRTLLDISADARAALADRVDDLADQHRLAWEFTSRPGGGDDSAAKLRDVATALRA
jgi:hexosaminidase